MKRLMSEPKKGFQINTMKLSKLEHVLEYLRLKPMSNGLKKSKGQIPETDSLRQGRFTKNLCVKVKEHMIILLNWIWIFISNFMTNLWVNVKAIPLLNFSVTSDEIEESHIGAANTGGKYSNLIYASSLLTSAAKDGEDYKQSTFTIDASGRNTRTVYFLVDSGATIHSVSDPSLLDSLRNANVRVHGAQGPFNVTQVGRLTGAHVNVLYTGNQMEFSLENVHVMEKCKHNILSPLRLRQQMGARFLFDGDSSQMIMPTGEVIPLVQRWGLPFLPVRFEKADHLESALHSVIEQYSYPVGQDLFQKRLGYMSTRRVNKMMSEKSYEGVNVKASSTSQNRAVECVARSTRANMPSHRSQPTRAVYPFHTVHSDVASCGVTGFEEEKYFVTFIDVCTRYSFVYAMKAKSEVPEKFRLFLSEMKSLCRQHGKEAQIERLFTDNGGEYLSEVFEDICHQHSITHITTVPETPQENGLAERLNRTLFTMANSMLFGASLAAPFWARAVLYANWIRNRCPTQYLGSKSPFQALTGKLPNLHMARVFGCDAYVHEHDHNKIGTRAKKGLFVGIHKHASDSAPRWLVFDLDTRQVKGERHVVMLEDVESRRNHLREYDDRLSLAEASLSEPVEQFKQDVDSVVRRTAIRRLFMLRDALGQTAQDQDLLNRVGVDAKLDGINDDPSLPHPVGDQFPPTIDHDEEELGDAQPRLGKFNIDHGPLSQSELDKASTRREAEMSPGQWAVRPIRLAAVGKNQPLSDADKLFIEHATNHEYPVIYLQDNPKKGVSRSRYELYKGAETLQQAKVLGASRADINWDYSHGFIYFPDHESSEMAGYIGSEVNLIICPKSSYNEQIASIFPPEDTVDFMGSKLSIFNFGLKCISSIFAITELEKPRIELKDPENYWDIKSHPHKDEWYESVKSEIAGLLATNTINEWIPLEEARKDPNFSKPLKTRYVFRTKTDANGVAYKRKARLVVRGDLAIEGLHFDDVFAPTTSYSSVRLLLSLAAGNNYEIYQADISQAFLQAPLEKAVFIEKPPIPFEDNKGVKYVGKLKRSLYGLPSSPRNWYQEYSKYLLKLGFVQCVNEPCVFWKKKGNNVLYTSVFVDDALIVGNAEMRREFIEQLAKRFPVNKEETREADWLLGVKISRDPINGNIHLTQEEAIKRLAEACGVENDRNKVFYNTPLVPQIKLKKAEQHMPNLTLNGLSYRSVIGSLLFIALCVRPDIAHAVGLLARFADAHDKSHFDALKRVVQYLNRTREMGITYTSNTPDLNRLITYVDADFAGSETCRSTSGYTVIMNGGPIAWNSRIQKVTAQSTTEAETIAAAECVKEVIYYRNFLKELGFKKECEEPSCIMEDNSAVISYANSVRNRVAARHYVVKLRFLQECVVGKIVKFVQTPTEHQLADIFTKPLTRDQFKYLRDQIFGIQPTQPNEDQLEGRLNELGGGEEAHPGGASLVSAEYPYYCYNWPAAGAEYIYWRV